MRFELEIRSKTGNAINIKTQSVGTKWIDEIRAKTGIERLTLDKIPFQTAEICKDILIELPEHLARASKKFDDSYNAIVIVPPDLLNKFCKHQINADKDPETGETMGMRITPRADKKAIVAAWAAAGYPLRWGFEEGET